MKTIGPFFDLENQRWIFFIFADEPGKIYIQANSKLEQLKPNQVLWVWHPEEHYFQMTYQGQKISYINLFRAELPGNLIYQFLGKTLDKYSEYFTPKEKLTTEEKRSICDEFKSKVEKYKRPESQLEVRSIAIATVETVPLSLDLDTINQQITDYPLDETLRAEILEELDGEWPFKDTSTDDFKIKVASRILGGDPLKESDLMEKEDPSEILRFKWMIDSDYSYAGFNGIDETQKQNARYFVGQLFAQVLRVLNASENIPQRYLQLTPPEAQPNSVGNFVEQPDENSEVYDIEVQKAIVASINTANLDRYSNRFLNLDKKTRECFINFISKPSEDSFKNCIYHDAVNNIWQTILYYLRVIGYYLYFGRFYELNLALTELSQPEIQEINKTLFPGISETSLDSMNDLMFRC